ncbi:TPA: autotransporter outer membrane beta-barrel domain-containing protein, partial [Escherichia coli]|nr:autotransporter outer membrane beta-barrel domain-containing protein [Escherichia coli]HAX5233358.1 autotransporter outer membrane beta-barrel domain-containing protein [Escherichia coli]
MESGSIITGDIVLEADSSGSGNSLSITNNDTAAVSVDGNLVANNSTSLTFAGQTTTFSGNASFDGTALSFVGSGDNVGGLATNGTITFSNGSTVSVVTPGEWTQKDYKLLYADATAGISGFTSSMATITNPLLTAGAVDFTGVSRTDNKTLTYGLRWFDETGKGMGEFNLKSGATLKLALSLEDNAFAGNNWDGISLTKSGEGELILADQNTYTGTTTVSDGMLTLATTNAIAGSSGVTVESDLLNSTRGILNLSGNSQVLNSLVNNGTLLINDYGANVLTSPVTVTGSMMLEQNGLVVLNNGATNAGQVWIQDGDWNGNGGTVSLGTVLGDDSSKTDKLQITGKATGKTYVSVTNEGGSGAQTVEGIEVITTGASDADAFIQSGRITAGVYEYSLVQGGNGGNQNNWYLTSL